MSLGQLPRVLGRYVLYDQIASGGMATVHFGRLLGAVGFSRVVAIKRLHTHYASDAHFVQMFLDEARLAARLNHPNIISTLDVMTEGGEVFLVMEYVLGESLEALMPRGAAAASSRAVPLPIAVAIVANVLEGLHGAHEARSDTGEHLEIVHRDVSPHNVLVGADGVARVFDFGIAKAAINTHETREGVIKGKVRYMAPEQVRGTVDRRSDVYAVGVILWELLVGKRRHAGERNDTLFLKLAKNELDAPESASTIRLDVPAAMDAIIARATATDPDERYATAREMAEALEAAVRPAVARDVADWVRELAGDRLDRLASTMQGVDTGTLTRAGGVTSTVPSAAPPAASFAPNVSSYAAAPLPPRRSWTMPAALLAFTAAMLLVGLRALLGRGAAPSHPQDVATAPLAAAASMPPVVTETTETTAASAPSASATTATTPSASVSAPTTPAPRPVQPAFVWQPRSAPRAPEVVPAAAAPGPVSNAPAASEPRRPSCEMPFVVGADGIRQIKPECM